MKRLLILAVLLFCTPLAAQSPFPTNVALKSTQATHDTNVTVIKASGGTVYGVEAFNNGTSVAYVKLYNTATATCGSGTPYARYMIPAMAAGAFGGVMLTSNANGDAYVNGINLCITTGFADSDTTAPAASTFIVNVHYQ